MFQEGDEGKELFVIGEGEVEIRKESASGESMTLARLGPGNFFGELSFIDQRPRSASAVARGVLDVYVVPAETLERAIEYNVGAALYLTSIICKIMAQPPTRASPPRRSRPAPAARRGSATASH